MDELLKVLVFRGDETQQDVEINRNEFEKALDRLFSSDMEETELKFGNMEMKGVTDIVLAGADLAEVEEEAEKKAA